MQAHTYTHAKAWRGYVAPAASSRFMPRENVGGTDVPPVKGFADHEEGISFFS